MSWLRLSLLSISLVGLAACSTVHVGSDDAGTDAGSREQCGTTICDVGQVCCNASCGICTAPGLACPAIACETGCTSNADCGNGEYCAMDGCPDGSRTGTCTPRPDACPAVEDPVCGCDGTTYGNFCAAGASGVNVASTGACGPGGTCDADDAAGDGLCDAIVGIAWDGSRCVGLSGCSCVGSDCGKYMTEEQCWAEHASCVGCAADDSRIVGECATPLGIRWNGSTCESVSGCSCEGADCNRWNSLEACQAAHTGCPGTGTCTDASDCDMGEWCQTPVGMCGGVGVCAGPPPPGLPCDPAMDTPVCGCDGNTYDCDRAALSSSINIAFEGACEGVCAPQDARGVGPMCPAIHGVAWDGTRCDWVGGCGCDGTDCGNLYMSIEDCEAATRGCDQAPGGSCGGFAGLTCRPDEFCDYEAADICGAADALGTCRPRPTGCFDIFMPVCGCDGMTYGNGCEAHAAGTDYAGEGSC